MTVKTLHTFTDAEMQMVEGSLRVAGEWYRKLADEMRRAGVTTLEREYDRMADAAGELAMKIETSR